jgi:hypothetical protein
MSDKTLAVWSTAIGDIAPTKFGLELMADTIAELVSEGQADPISVMIRMSALNQLTTLVKERIQQMAIDELYRHPKMQAQMLGAEVALVDTPKYDYSLEPDWAELEEQIGWLRDKQKEIEHEAKRMRRGEIPVKSVSQSIRVNLAK